MTFAAVGLLGPSDIRALASRLGVRPAKSLGQNFVVDSGTVRRVARLGVVDDGGGLGCVEDRLALGSGVAARVVEVGPGFGSLTLALLEAGAEVVAVEIDPLLARALPETVAQRAPSLTGRLTVVEADALRVDSLPGTPPQVLVANLPYNVAVPVILRFLERFPEIERAVVMVQAEVSDRLVADPGSRVYGVPSAKRAWFASARRAGGVGRAAFWPVPRVDSALVVLERRDPPETTAPREEVFAVVDAAFSQRRKMLRSALATWAGGVARAEEVLVRAGVPPTTRGERLGIDDFARIAEAARSTTTQGSNDAH
ncbi:MAG: 16S rRNA (adenine(1518)-N(6)/adenine(1519)-N(6))-dimethyltransferase RsmA [Micrococcales bacterium]|nr:16S rRNA (adenine(1518)-N(6)/adenine(1519)-N(6))-dimethyltransferase RsmA [Micrococcales bacterium]